MSARKPNATRIEAVEWAMRNMCDFLKPVPKPPKGWAWVESNDVLVLSVKNSKARHADISPVDVVRRMFRTKGNG